MKDVLNLLRERIMLSQKEISQAKDFMELYPDNCWKKSILQRIKETEKFILQMNDAINILNENSH